MKIFRNILAVVLGIIVYVILDYIAIFVIGFALAIPILSQLMTCFIIPKSIFLAAAAPYIAIMPTIHIIKALSDHNDVNYSGIVVFTVLLIFAVFTFVNYTVNNGFIWMQLISSIIKCGFFIFGIAISKDGYE